MKNSHKFRELTPKRSPHHLLKNYKKYQSYKKYLRLDFGQRCGYTNCSDSWFGGSKSFHIDHLKPKSLYPHLETDYSNLVYSCSYVNEKKANHDGPFLDPCNVDYNDHFFRDEEGNICANPESASAKYMCNILCLNLRRYGLIWQLEQLNILKKELKDVITKKYKTDSNEEITILKLYMDLDETFDRYFTYLQAEL